MGKNTVPHGIQRIIIQLYWFLDNIVVLIFLPLCSYLDCNTAYFRQFKTDCDKGFSTVISRIEETVYNQKFTGAAAGFLNANIISRDLGLSDRVHNELSGELKHSQVIYEQQPGNEPVKD